MHFLIVFGGRIPFPLLLIIGKLQVSLRQAQVLGNHGPMALNHAITIAARLLAWSSSAKKGLSARSLIAVWATAQFVRLALMTLLADAIATISTMSTQHDDTFNCQHRILISLYGTALV